MMQAANVLDHGYVKLLNVAGPVRGQETSVSDIAKAARVSFANYGQERALEDDVKLSKYLWRNEHMTPFEMVQTWWEVKAPIFVARQWFRHRTCITGNMVISFDAPKKKYSHYGIKMSDLYDKWANGAREIPHAKTGRPTRLGMKDRISSMRIRSTHNGNVVADSVIGVVCNGVKPVRDYTTESGKVLSCTSDHEVNTPYGYVQAGSLSVGDRLVCISRCEQKMVGKPVEYDTEEVWVPSPVFGDRYDVSNHGRVRSHVNTRCVRLAEPVIKKLTACKRTGYMKVSLSDNGVTRLYSVHRLVMFAFSDHPGGYSTTGFVCHKDSNPWNNSPENLYLGDPRSNTNDRYKTGAKPWLSIKTEKIVSISDEYMDVVYDISTKDVHNFFANGINVHNCSINEISGRYVKLPEEWYIPDVVGGKPVTNKQGRSENLDRAVQEDFREQLNKACEESYILYQNAIENGVAPEHARMALHQNHYTQWLWKIDLRNLLHFLRLRTDEHAQWEIRQYAATMRDMIYSSINGLKEVIEQ